MYIPVRVVLELRSLGFHPCGKSVSVSPPSFSLYTNQRLSLSSPSDIQRDPNRYSKVINIIRQPSTRPIDSIDDDDDSNMFPPNDDDDQREGARLPFDDDDDVYYYNC